MRTSFVDIYFIYENDETNVMVISDFRFNLINLFHKLCSVKIRIKRNSSEEFISFYME